MTANWHIAVQVYGMLAAVFVPLLLIGRWMNGRRAMRSFQIHWDSDYGIDHRRGWSVVYDGSVVVQFEKRLIVALWKSWRSVRQWELQ